jgi:hypothetical protein
VATPSLTLSTDAQSYAPGQTITLTAQYADVNTVQFTVNVTATATDAAGNAVNANTQFQVVTQAPVPMTVTVSDDHNDVWTQVSDNGAGTVVFSTSAPAA